MMEKPFAHVKSVRIMINSNQRNKKPDRGLIGVMFVSTSIKKVSVKA